MEHTHELYMQGIRDEKDALFFIELYTQQNKEVVIRKYRKDLKKDVDFEILIGNRREFLSVKTQRKAMVTNNLIVERYTYRLKFVGGRSLITKHKSWGVNSEANKFLFVVGNCGYFVPATTLKKWTVSGEFQSVRLMTEPKHKQQLIKHPDRDADIVIVPLQAVRQDPTVTVITKGQ